MKSPTATAASAKVAIVSSRGPRIPSSLGSRATLYGSTVAAQGGTGRRYPPRMLNHQIAWYFGGPILGLCVVAARALVNQRLGVTGSFANVVDRVADRSF